MTVPPPDGGEELTVIQLTKLLTFGTQLLPLAVNENESDPPAAATVVPVVLNVYEQGAGA